MLMIVIADTETPGQIIAVGTQLASWAETLDVKNHRWADTIMDRVKPNAGDNGLGVRNT